MLTRLFAGTRFASLRHDEAMLGLVFAALILVTGTVLARDLFEQMQAAPARAGFAMPGEEPLAVPFLPSSRPGTTPRRGSGGAELEAAMTIDLTANGRLEATGVITPGTFERFRAEVEKRAEYVKTVVLNSPGGSVQDALAMAKLIRAKGFDTLVERGGLCASSCPLVYAGGVARIAAPGAALGVHQMIALATPGSMPTPGDGMARAQSMAAECQRLLIDMGVDLRVWVHAMETLPEEIFYFTDEEVMELRLATRRA